MIGKDDRSKEEPKQGSFKGYHMMRFQRLSKEGPHWWLRKLILKKRQSKTWNLTHGNVDLHRRPRRCRTKCNEGDIDPIFAKQQLNSPAPGIKVLSPLRFFRAALTQPCLVIPCHSSSSLVSRLLPLVSSLLTSVLPEKTFVLSDVTSVLSHVTSVWSVVTFFWVSCSVRQIFFYIYLEILTLVAQAMVCDHFEED